MRGFGSKACCAGPDRRFAGIELSESSSTKSLTMKSLFEKFSKVKLGPLGKIGLPPAPRMELLSIDAIAPRHRYYIKCCDYPFPLVCQYEVAIPFAHVMCRIERDVVDVSTIVYAVAQWPNPNSGTSRSRNRGLAC
jgi:hypothetical protein